MEYNIADLFESLVDAIPEKEALISAGKRLTYRELDNRANKLAHALSARGIGPGSHVGLYLFNGAEFVEAMLALFKIRAVPINVNYRYVDEELRFLCANADLAGMLFQREFTPRVAAIAASVPTLKTFVVVEDGSKVEPTLECTEYETLVATGKDGRDFPERSADDLYVIYTGGTTGMPRGVMWRHEDVLFAGLQGGNPGGAPIEKPEDLAGKVAERMALNLLPAAPFMHGAAQWAALIGLFSGGKVILSPGRSFQPKDACRLVTEEKVTTMTMVGDAMARPLVDALREGGGAYDMSSLMVISSAGAILSDSVKADLQELLPNTMILNSFGASETGHQGTVYPGGVPGARPRFFMDGSSTVLDDDLKPVAPGSGIVGKLARTGHLPIGYYKDPEKTAATFLKIDGVRWVVPGDLATVEADGAITVFGRGAVCINSGGEKIFPEEVESALKAHPAIEDAVVVGIPDARWGERVTAIIQPREGQTVTLELIDVHCRTHVAGYKIPRQIRVVEQIVRHPSGKPDYRWAKDAMLSSGLSGETAQGEG